MRYFTRYRAGTALLICYYFSIGVFISFFYNYLLISYIEYMLVFGTCTRYKPYLLYSARAGMD